MRKRRKRRLKRAVVVILLALVGAFLYLYFRPPSTAPPAAIKVDMSPERIARGEYLFTVLCDCDGCHSERDYSRFGGPVMTRGKGQIMPLSGLPGRAVASNLTPDQETGLGNWTDGEKIRAIREGVGRDGRALYPMMPYPNYRTMGDYDVESVVAYMNTLTPVKNPLPKTELQFPVSMFMKGAPRPVQGRVESVHPSAGEIYGQYLVTLASCETCHTPPAQPMAFAFWQQRDAPDLSRRFGGGRVFDTFYGRSVSSNISGDKATGLGGWDYLRFAEKFHSFRPFARGESPKVGPDKYTVMPWLAYSKLTDHDLERIFYYAKSRPGVK